MDRQIQTTRLKAYQKFLHSAFIALMLHIHQIVSALGPVYNSSERNMISSAGSLETSMRTGQDE
jgi:hypothetical protein